MANAQVILDRIPTVGGKPYLRFNIIDNGDGTVAVYVEERPNSDGISLASAIPASGSRIVGSASGTVTGDGTTNTLPKWTNGPGSVLGDSRLVDNEAEGFITINGVGGTIDIGDTDLVGNKGLITVENSGPGSVRIESPGELQLGDPLNFANSVTLKINQSTQTVTVTAPFLTLVGTVINFPDGIRQIFNPDGTTPGVNVGAVAGDPSTPINGDIWYDSTGNLLRARINGVTRSLGTGVPGGADTQVQYNNAGIFAGITGLTTDGTNVTAGSGNLRTTLPRITTGINDANGLPIIALTATPSAVNNLVISNTATGAASAGPLISVTGTDASISMKLRVKANGILFIQSDTNDMAGFDGNRGGMTIAAGQPVAWSNTALDVTAARDLRITRNASAIAAFDNGTAGQWAGVKLGFYGTATNTVSNGLTVGTRSSGAPAAGLGAGLLFNIDSSTTADRNAAQIAASWTAATDASRTAQLQLLTVTNAGALAAGLTINQGAAVLVNYTVATLPSASGAGAGALAFVTDATLTAITGLGLAVTGGGANKVVVYSDGTNWIIL
jgi:hypothetical protein